MVGLRLLFNLPCKLIIAFADERVTLDFGRALQQARMAKKLTQKELATVSRELNREFPNSCV